MRALVLAFLCSAVAVAHADEPTLPRLQLDDRGDHVLVIARGATIVDPAAVTIDRERLEWVIAGGPREARRSYEDRTIRRVEVRGAEPRRLSIKLRADRKQVGSFATAVVARQVGDDIHVIIPRRPTAPPPAVAATTVATAAPTAAPIATAAAAPTAAPTATTAATPTAVTTPTAAPPAEVAAPIATAPTAVALPRPVGGAAGAGARWPWLLGGLALVGGGLYALVRRRRVAAPAHGQLEILDSRAIGPKARVVWLGAGRRELVVAISPTQVRLLGQWSRPEAAVPTATALPATTDDGPRMASGSSRLRAVPGPAASPAVSGILRLRERTSPLADDIATDDVDADEQWARDILAATGGRR